MKTSDRKVSRPWRLINGVPQGSKLAPLLFNLYISDLPQTIPKQYGYADDLVLLFLDKNWNIAELILGKDFEKVESYLKKWRLKLSKSKATATAFYLKTREAIHPLTMLILKISHCPRLLNIWASNSIDRSHLSSTPERLMHKNDTSDILLQRLAESSWGANTLTIQTDALTIVHNAAEYVFSVWCRCKHTKKLDICFNHSLRTITSCLRPTPTKYLLVLLWNVLPSFCKREHC